MREDIVVQLRQPGSFEDDPLTEVLRLGARRLLGQAVAAEVAGFVEAYAHLTDSAALLVKRLRQAWPAVRLTVRADSGFCRHKMLSWCERHEVGYIVGLAKNARINDQAARGMALAAAAYERTGEKQRVFADLSYGARSWNKERRVIARLEHGPKGVSEDLCSGRFVRH